MQKNYHNSAGRAGKIEKPLDFCTYISYNIITVKENLISKAGKSRKGEQNARNGYDR